MANVPDNFITALFCLAAANAQARKKSNNAHSTMSATQTIDSVR
jgi:hypothetical protein